MLCKSILVVVEGSSHMKRYVSQVAERRIPADLAIATDTHISTRTISRPLNQVGLYVQKPVGSTPLQLRYRPERLL